MNKMTNNSPLMMVGRALLLLNAH